MMTRKPAQKEKMTSVRQLQNSVRPVLKRYGVRRCALFGSMARRQATRSSDVDLLIDVAPQTTLFDLVGLREDLAQVTGRDVDLVTVHSLHPTMRRRVRDESVLLYEFCSGSGRGV